MVSDSADELFLQIKPLSNNSAVLISKSSSPPQLPTAELELWGSPGVKRVQQPVVAAMP